MNIPIESRPGNPVTSAAVLRPVITNQRPRKQAPLPSESLERRVNGLRLAKMLDKLGVPREGYFRIMTREIIERHIRNCQRCTRSRCVHICDAYLDEGRPVKNMRFCPNYPSLIANSPAFYRGHGRHQGTFL